MRVGGCCGGWGATDDGVVQRWRPISVRSSPHGVQFDAQGGFKQTRQGAAAIACKQDDGGHTCRARAALDGRGVGHDAAERGFRKQVQCTEGCSSMLQMVHHQLGCRSSLAADIYLFSDTATP